MILLSGRHLYISCYRVTSEYSFHKYTIQVRRFKFDLKVLDCSESLDYLFNFRPNAGASFKHLKSNYCHCWVILIVFATRISIFEWWLGMWELVYNKLLILLLQFLWSVIWRLEQLTHLGSDAFMIVINRQCVHKLPRWLFTWDSVEKTITFGFWK